MVRIVVMTTGAYRGVLFSSREISSSRSKVKLLFSSKAAIGLNTNEEYNCSSSSLKPVQLLKRNKK